MNVNIYAKPPGNPGPPGDLVWQGRSPEECGGIPRAGDLIAVPGMGQPRLSVYSVRRYLGANPFTDVYAVDRGDDGGGPGPVVAYVTSDGTTWHPEDVTVVRRAGAADG